MNKKFKLYNTLTKKEEPFVPFEEGKVRMYVCGPTVYDLLHIGNFRGAIFFNFFRNWLESLGYQVTFIYNYTDVDDKIIKRANEEGKDALQISAHYIEEFEKDFCALKLTKHCANPKVTDHMQDIVSVTEKLVENGKAYVVEGEVIYSIDSFPDYGKLSGKKLDELEAGSRVEVSNKKKNPLDFVLWKPSKEGEPSWDSPWGKGRPGWHIECTCMILNKLGEQIDIHGGGIDLIFPHHENEIAQAEGATGKVPCVKYWMHNNFIRFGDEKMSKSLGNVMTARSFLENYHPEILKYMFLSVHYRSQLNFDKKQVVQTINSLKRIYTALSFAEGLNQGNVKSENLPKDFASALEAVSVEVDKALREDINTTVLFAKLFELVRMFNALLGPARKITDITKAAAYGLKRWVAVYAPMLSLFEEEPKSFLKVLDDMLLDHMNLKRADIDELVEGRNQARKEKDFSRADELRDKLVELGILIQDLPEGTIWEVQAKE